MSEPEGTAPAGEQETAPRAEEKAGPPEAPKPDPAEPARAPLPPVPPAQRVASVFLGFGAMALVDIVMFATRPYARTPIGVRAVAEVVSAGYLLGMGAILAACVAVWRRVVPRSVIASFVAIALLSWALGFVFYGEDLSGLADSLSRTIPQHWVRMAVLTLALSLSVPIAVFVVGRVVDRWHWSAGLLLGAAGIVLNGMQHDYPDMHLFISQSYPGVHMLVAVLSSLMAGLSIARMPESATARVPRLSSITARGWMAIAGVATVWGALSLALRPSNAVLLDLQRYPGAVLFPFLGKLHEQVRGTPNVPAGKEEWFADRSKLPPVQPTSPKLLPDDAIILLLGIDSMRAEMLADEKYRDDLPELFRLRDESVYFPNARSAGTSTAPSIASMFADVYYSQLYWQRTTLSDTSLVFPHADEKKRFPELLTAAGIDTYTSDGTTWLINSHGIIRGFTEEVSQRRGDYTRAQLLLNPVIARLKKDEDTKQFYFVHMLDAHSPYTSAGKRTSPFLGYVAELARIDRQLDRLMKELARKKLLSRTAIVIMADHGEAFGEHGTQRHAVSLYDELLRVPLMIRLPNKQRRVVTDAVSLIDIAPTILDMMNVPTPGHYMGQSLTGYLRGEDPKLERPIVAEARLKRSMVMPDGFKVIYDTQTHVVEIYDIKSDPREENNLYREGDPVSAQRLGALTSFFDAHTLRRPGYKVPYRKW